MVELNRKFSATAEKKAAIADLLLLKRTKSTFFRNRGQVSAEEELIDDFRDRGDEVRDRGKVPGAPDDVEVVRDDYVRPSFPLLILLKPPAPFPEALKDTRRVENDKDLFEAFSNCEVNIPLIKLVQSIPRYAKFLKELCKIKRKKAVKEKKKIQVSDNVSAMLQKRLPKKCSDPDMSLFPVRFEKAMLECAWLGQFQSRRFGQILSSLISTLPFCYYRHTWMWLY